MEKQSRTVEKIWRAIKREQQLNVAFGLPAMTDSEALTQVEAQEKQWEEWAAANPLQAAALMEENNSGEDDGPLCE